FVAADRALRLERCRQRGWSEAELARREAFFIPSPERRARSDYVIENHGSLEDLRKNVRTIYERMKGARGCI
ncbi:MAG: dephospho-CoA kinase, partial [Fretibacterium sp.]|nr:dephospho-CoA kinase [Fretibacterium sp.]